MSFYLSPHNNNRSKPTFTRRQLYIAVAVISHMVAIERSYALPQNGRIEHGTGAIDQEDTAIRVSQETPYLVIDWDSFDVSVGNTVEFIQLSGSAIALNKVVGSSAASTIRGNIAANGNVVLVNTKGIVFESGSAVNVGGLIASGLDIHITDFQTGEVTFSSMNGAGSVENYGAITATEGDITLLGSSVSNSHILDSLQGDVTLMAGREAVLTFNESAGIIGIKLTEAALQGVEAVSNSGEITADGRILLSASAQQDLPSYAVNNGDLPRSPGVIVHEDGSFTLGSGGNVVNTGELKTTSVTGNSSIALIGENVETAGTITSDGAVALHGRSSVEVSGQVSGEDIQLTAGLNGCDAGETGCSGGSGQIDLHSGGSLLATDAIEILAADNVTLAGTIGGGPDHHAQLTVRAGNAIQISGAVQAGSSSTAEPAVLLSAGDNALQGMGFGASVDILAAPPGGLAPASITITDSINSNGGGVHLFAKYDPATAETVVSQGVYAGIQVDGEIQTGGGDIQIGSFDSRVGSFTATTALQTHSDTSGGSIIIHAVGDIELHSASFGGTEPNNVADVGSIEATSYSGDIALHGRYEYNSIKHNARGSVRLTAKEGSISLANFSADDGENGRSRLSIELQAKESVEVQIGGNAWLNGGAFSATSDDNNIKIHGGTIHTEGGSVTLHANSILLSGDVLNTAGDDFGRSGGAVTFNGNVVLNGATSILTGPEAISNPSDRGKVEFNGTLKSSNTLSPYTLKVLSDDLFFGDEVTGFIDLYLDATGKVSAAEQEINVASLNASAADFSSGNITTVGGKVWIDVGSGDINTGSVSTTGAVGGDGGAIELTGRRISVVDLISNAGSGENLNAGAIQIVAVAEEGRSASVNINGDISSAYSNSDQRNAIITLGGTCADCTNTVHFNGETFITGNVAVLGSTGFDSISVSRVASSWAVNGDADHQISGQDNATSGSISFRNFEELVGSDQSDHFHISALPSSNLSIKGSANPSGSHSDLLEGPSVDGSIYQWHISGTNTGTLQTPGGSSGVVEYERITDLRGGLSVDEFIFDINGSIQHIDGGVGPATIQGKDGNNTWNLNSGGFSLGATGQEDNYLNSFVNIDRLQGGSGDDEFIIETSFAGHLAGGEGQDSFHFGRDGSVGSIDGGFDVSSGSTATLYGRDSHNIWSIHETGSEVRGTVVESASEETAYVGEFWGIDHLVGGNDVDEFNIDAAFTGTISGSEGADVFNIRAAVTGDLHGGQGNDAFLVEAAVNGDLYGDDGDDHVSIESAVIGSIHGGDGNDTFTLGLAGSADSIIGGAGYDVLQGYLTGATWTIEQSGEGSLTGEGAPISFGSMEALLGGDEGEDVFVFSNSGSIDRIDGGHGSASIQGKNGNNTWHLRSTGFSLGTSGQEDNYLKSFVNIDSLQGGSGDDEFIIETSFAGHLAGGEGQDSFHFGRDGSVGSIDGGFDVSSGSTATLYGRDSHNIWSIHETGSEVRGTVVESASEETAYVGEFWGIDHLVGGNDVDEFNIVAAFTGAIFGSEGDDVFNIKAVVTGSLHGGGGADQFFIENVVTESIRGGDGDDTFTLALAGRATSIIGDDGYDVFHGYSTGGTWTINTVGSGLLEGAGASIDFVSMEELLGGDEGEDVFVFQDGGSIEHIDGGHGLATIQGKNGNNTWSLNSAGFSLGTTGQENNYLKSFVNIDSLQGGSGDDEFIIETSFAGHLAGGEGQDSFHFGRDGSVGSIDGGFDVSSGSTATLYGRDSHNIWSIHETVSGVRGTLAESASQETPYVGEFWGIDHLVGGNDVDEFNINTEFVGSIQGGDGDDLFSIRGVVTGNLHGDDGSDTFELSSTIQGDVHGGRGDDTFVFHEDGHVQRILGGEGVDSINGKSNPTTWHITSADSGVLLGPGGAYLEEFDGIERLIGGSANDTFQFSDSGSISGGIWGGEGENTISGRNTASSWEITGENSGWISDRADGEIYLAAFHNIANLHGGSNTDIFSFQPDGLINSAIRGGGGDDLIVGRPESSMWLITGPNAGSVTDANSDLYVASFSEIESLMGGSGDDRFIFTVNSSSLRGSIDGGGGANTIVGRPSDTNWYLDVGAPHSGRLEGVAAGPYALFYRVQSLTGNAGYKNRLFGRNQINHWSVLGLGSGTVSEDGNPSDQILFSGMTGLVGNEKADFFRFAADGYIADVIDGRDGDDSFYLTSSSTSVVIGGGGNDELHMTLKESASGQITIDDVENIEMVGHSGLVRHSFESAMVGVLQYSLSGNDYLIRYEGAEQITDAVIADSLTVTGRISGADEFFIIGGTTSANSFSLNGDNWPSVSFQDKANVVFNAKSGDVIRIGGDLETTRSVTVRNATVVHDSGTIRTDKLYLDGTSTVGSADGRLNTAVNQLFFAGTQGGVFISELDGLTIGQSTIGGLVDISLLSGSLSSNVALVSGDDFIVNAVAGDINLERSNRLTGQLSFSAAGAVRFVNAASASFAHLSADAVDIQSSGDIHAQSSIHVTNLAAFRAKGSITLENRNNRFGSIHIDDADSVALASDRGFSVSGVQASGPISIFSSEDLRLTGNLESAKEISIVTRTGIEQGQELRGTRVSLESDGGIFMSADATSIASESISYKGGEISLGHLVADKVDITSGTYISDSNGNAANITANRLSLVAESGIGGADALETMVEQLFIRNNSGNAQVVNGQEVWITGLKSNGDVHFRNTNGDVHLAHSTGQAYQRYHDDARYAGGLVDANYEIGSLVIDIDNGYLLTTALPDMNYPVLAARNMILTSPRGGIGQPLYPLVVYVKDNLVLVSARPSWIRYAFESRPAHVDDTGTISGDIADLIGAGNEQLVEIEPLSDIDPAVFTNVRNYSYDDIAIRLPNDQLYHFDDEED